MATLVEANPHNTAAAAVVHPLIVRLTHWVNAGAMIVMLMSGWQIHNAYPTLSFSFPGMLTLGDGLAGGLRWHFAAMWVLVITARSTWPTELYPGGSGASCYPSVQRTSFEMFGWRSLESSHTTTSPSTTPYSVCFMLGSLVSGPSLSSAVWRFGNRFSLVF